VCRHTPKKRDFSYRQRKGENEERNIFCEREKREEFEFFFSDRANGKRGRRLFWCVFLEKRQKRMSFTDFWREISRGTSSSSSNVTSPARALRITTHE